jgi:hypothetical protein
MPNDSQQRAAVFYQFAARVDRPAVGHWEESITTDRERSKQALERANRAWQTPDVAHTESSKRAGRPLQ